MCENARWAVGTPPFRDARSAPGFGPSTRTTSIVPLQFAIENDRMDGMGQTAVSEDTLAERTFRREDQQWFAAFSGDHNPLHLDPTVARRSLFGQPVVHGVHAVLWSIDALMARRPCRIGRVKVTFRKPLFLEESLDVVVDGVDTESVRLHLRRDEATLAVVELGLLGTVTGPSVPEANLSSMLKKAEVAAPHDRTSTNLRGAQGELDLEAFGVVAPDGAFPAATAALGAPTIAALAALSRLVGMECPGLHSLFAGFDVDVGAPSEGNALSWQVQRVDDRVGAVRMTVSGGSLEGRVDAFIRPLPAAQPTANDLASKVDESEFFGMRALVVGGSRGLGELTAKLVASGGGEPVVTWHRGEADAASVVADIESAGGRASALHLDIEDPAPAVRELAALEVEPTHVFYFASPRIFARRTLLFDRGLFLGFVDAYVVGFARVLAALRRGGATDLRVYYPSTVAVEEGRKDLTEYISAKSAGEAAARTLSQTEPWLRVCIERLPRLPTDQTATLLQVPTDDPADHMLGAIRNTARL